MALEAGDKVRTDASGKATITFFEGSTVELNGDTALSLQELGINADQSTVVRIKQDIGETMSRAKKLIDTGDRYEIETPAAVAAVRGTVMFVKVMLNGVTFVGNVEGLVSVAAKGKEVMLPEGMNSTINPGEEPSAPKPGATPAPAPAPSPAPSPSTTTTPLPTTTPTVTTTTPAPTSTTLPVTTTPPPVTITTTTMVPLWIKIVSLQQGDLVGRTIIVSGVVSDPTITAGTISVNGNTSSMVVSQGAFSVPVTLADGANTIVVSVTKNGITATASVDLVPEAH